MSVEYQYVGSLWNSYLTCTSGGVLKLLNVSLSWITKAKGSSPESVSAWSQFRNSNDPEYRGLLKKEHYYTAQNVYC